MRRPLPMLKACVEHRCCGAACCWASVERTPSQANRAHTDLWPVPPWGSGTPPSWSLADWSRIGSVRLWQHRHRLSWEASLSFRESALWPVPPGAESRTSQASLVSVGSVWLRDAGGRHRSRSEPLLRPVGILARIRSVRPAAAAERSACCAGTRRWSKAQNREPSSPFGGQVIPAAVPAV